MTLPKEIAQSLYLIALLIFTSGAVLGTGLLAIRVLG
jgi:hypothetical protein